MDTLTAWKLVSAQAVPEYGTVFDDTTTPVVLVSAYRETETRTYAAYVAADEPMPSEPVNPGALSPVGWQQTSSGWRRDNSWICEGRGFDREYGNPAPKIYRETWTKVGMWRRVDNG